MMTHEQFLARLDRTGECWLWTGGRTGRYGKVSMGRKARSVRAHRLAWEFEHGPVPEGLFVCHSCDTPLCCRVEHLFLGDNAANTADRVAKGRTRTWATDRARLGSAHPRAKITEEQVRVARIECAAGRRTRASYAREWGIANATAYDAINGATWTHVPMP